MKKNTLYITYSFTFAISAIILFKQFKSLNKTNCHSLSKKSFKNNKFKTQYITIPNSNEYNKTNTINNISKNEYTVTLSNYNPQQNTDVTIIVDGDNGTYSGVIKYKSKDTEIPITNVGTDYTFSVGRASTNYKTPIIIDVISKNKNKKTYKLFFTPCSK